MSLSKTIPATCCLSKRPTTNMADIYGVQHSTYNNIFTHIIIRKSSMFRYTISKNSNADCSSSPHFHFVFFSVRRLKVAVIDENLGMNHDRNAAILMKERTSETFVGGSMKRTVPTFSGSGFIPSAEKINPKKFISLKLNLHFDFLKVKLHSLNLCNKPRSAALCSCCVFP